MSQRVLFNGAVLVRPGAATKIDASQFENIVLAGIGTVGLIGEADGGAPRSVQVFGSLAGVKNFYKSGDLVEAAGLVANPGNDPRIPTGAQQIVCYKTNNSTGSTLAVAPHTFASQDSGLATNNINVNLVNVAGQIVITISTIDINGNTISEISPPIVGSLFTLLYTGTGSAATVSTTNTGLTTTVTGDTPSNLNLTFANYTSLAALLYAINSFNGGVYTAVPLITNAASLPAAGLIDLTTGVSIKTTPGSVNAHNYMLANWINQNSALITDTLGTAAAGPLTPPTPATQSLTGGTKGNSTNSDWVTAFSMIGGLRVNQVVPLCSSDGVSPDTYTMASVLAALSAHCKFYSSTQGRSERQGWIGMNATITNMVAAANVTNSPHIVFTGQKTQQQSAVTGNIIWLPEWSFACCLAGMRAGAPLGEPLTWKYINALGISSDASWSEANNDNCTTLALNGITYVNAIKGSGFRIDKCITTYTQSNNDAYMEETIVQIWKAFAYDLRTNLEQKFVGRPGNVKTVQQVPATVNNVGSLYEQAGALTPNIINGTTTPSYSGLSVSLSGDVMSVGLSITPTPGINFILNTLVLMPAQISL